MFIRVSNPNAFIFRYKDDIRDCGGIQALCRLLSLNRDPLVLQHILTSLASLAFGNDRSVCFTLSRFYKF